MKPLLEKTVIVLLLICLITILHSCRKLTLPEITTNDVSGITSTSAISGGNVINNGGVEVIARGVCWGTTANPTIDSNPNKTNDGTGNGTFKSTITNLSTNTQYHVRAYATNSEGTGYGNDVTFTTSCNSPSAPIIGTITQPTCFVITGSVVLSGLPSTGVWTLTVSPGGTTTTGTGSSTTITGLSAGTTYTFTVTNASGCESEASANVIINAQQEIPSAPQVGTITQPTCSVPTGSVVLSGLPSTGTWTLTRTPGGTTTTGSGTSTTVSGLPAGATYTFTVTNASGCISATSGNIVINAQLATPATPVVGTITQPTCSVAAGSVALSGLPATGSWTITRNPGSTTYSGTGTNYTITGLTAGTYTFTVTNVSGCISPASNNVTINSQPATPSAPAAGTITQPTCSVATGSVVLGGLPSSGNWILTRNPGGTTTTGLGTSTTISGLPAGTTYTFTITNASGCVSTASNNVTINSQPATPSAPVVGTITQPTCPVPTGSVILSGLPSSGNWTVTRSPGGTTTSGSGTSTTIPGLPAGTTYNFTVTNVSGCTSAASTNVTIGPPPTKPSATVNYATNISSKTVTLNGTVNANGNSTTVIFEYGTTTSYGNTVTAAQSPVTGTGNVSVNAEVSGLSRNTLYHFRVNATNCAGITNDNDMIFTTHLCASTIRVSHTAGDVSPLTKELIYGIVQTNLTGTDKCWIVKNLGADDIARSATDASEWSRGWFWQFNLKQGYSHDGTTKIPSTWVTPPISESSDWISANDPCTILLGPGWRIPTRSEWINVDNNGGWNNYNDAYSSVLKLHAAGDLNYLHGVLWNVGSYGSFWSSNQYYQLPNPGGWYLVISNSVSEMSYYSKAVGQSIRCLQD